MWRRSVDRRHSGVGAVGRGGGEEGEKGMGKKNNKGKKLINFFFITKIGEDVRPA